MAPLFKQHFKYIAEREKEIINAIHLYCYVISKYFCKCGKHLLFLLAHHPLSFVLATKLFFSIQDPFRVD